MLNLLLFWLLFFLLAKLYCLCCTCPGIVWYSLVTPPKVILCSAQVNDVSPHILKLFFFSLCVCVYCSNTKEIPLYTVFSSERVKKKNVATVNGKKINGCLCL
uniref:Secreted protein n=1 Tax=Anguilla anguilla TaxID=7936 RepID=A0A0E9X014_ANGAN